MSQVRFTLSPQQARELWEILRADRALGGRTSRSVSGRRVYERIERRLVIHRVLQEPAQ